MITCIIIDDETHCIGTLEILILNQFPNLSIQEKCRDGASGLKAIEAHQPDLVFLDIAMPKMNGFEMLSQIIAPTFEVIFTTAYDNYALKAFKVNAVDYLLKPIDKEEFNTAVVNSLRRIESKINNTQLISSPQLMSLMSDLRSSSTNMTQVAIPTLEGFQMIKTEDILYIMSDGNYSRIFVKDNNKILVTRTLKQLENILAKNKFLRIHRQTIVNLDHIDKYVKGDGGFVVLGNGKHLDVSRRKKGELLKLIRL